MKIEMKPDNFECTLAECPPGLFLFGDMIGLKSEYGDCEAYCDSGEAFWGGTDNPKDQKKLKVIPLTYSVISQS